MVLVATQQIAERKHHAEEHNQQHEDAGKLTPSAVISHRMPLTEAPEAYRMFEARRGAWSTFQFLVRQRLTEQGRDVASDGTLLQRA